MNFDWVTFLDAIALVFIIEGVLPFIRPESFKRYLDAMRKQPDLSLRIIGLVSMVIGSVILYLVRVFFEY